MSKLMTSGLSLSGWVLLAIAGWLLGAWLGSPVEETPLQAVAQNLPESRQPVPTTAIAAPMVANLAPSVEERLDPAQAAYLELARSRGLARIDADFARIFPRSEIGQALRVVAVLTGTGGSGNDYDRRKAELLGQATRTLQENPQEALVILAGALQDTPEKYAIEKQRLISMSVHLDAPMESKQRFYFDEASRPMPLDQAGAPTDNALAQSIAFDKLMVVTPDRDEAGRLARAAIIAQRGEARDLLLARFARVDPLAAEVLRRELVP